MDNITIPKEMFSKILEDVELLIDDVELALDMKVKKRVKGIESGIVQAKTEEDLDNYLKKRGVKLE